MTVMVTLSCSGCDAETSIQLRRELTVVQRGVRSGVDLCIIRTETIEEKAPDWWPWDPYTGVTYCPSCRAQIESSPPAHVGEATSDG